MASVMGLPMGIDWNVFWLLIQLLFYLGILLLLCVWVMRRLQYRYFVVILERTGDKDSVVIFDEAKVLKNKKGIKKLWLKGERQFYPLIDFKYKRGSRGGGVKKLLKRGTFFLYRYSEKSMTPLDISTTVNKKISVQKLNLFKRFLNKDESLNKETKESLTDMFYRYLNDFKMQPIDLSMALGESGEDGKVQLFALDSEEAQMQEHFEEIEAKTDFKSKWKELTPIIVSLTIGAFLIGGLVLTMIMNQDTQQSIQSAIAENSKNYEMNLKTTEGIVESLRRIAVLKDEATDKPPGFKEAVEDGGTG